MVTVEVNGITLHIPSAWNAFSFHGQWFVLDDATGQFVKYEQTPRRDDHLERSSGTSVPLNQND